MLGWVGNIFFISGVYALGRKWVYGFHANTIGNLLYLIQAILMKNWSLFWLSYGLMVLNMIGIQNWKGVNKKYVKLNRRCSKNK
jgi:hypothetical protein